MKKSRRIDDIYREKFRNVATAPPEDSWQNISAQLPGKKQKNRIAPLWYKIAGTAAILALFFTISNNYFHDNPQPGISSFSTGQQWSSENPYPSFTDFNESLLKTSSILEALAANTRNNHLEEQVKKSLEHNTNEKHPAGIHESLGNKNYSETKSTFSKFGDLNPQEIPMPEENKNSDGEYNKHTELAENNLKTSELNPSEEPYLIQELAGNGSKEENTIKPSMYKRFSVTTTAAAIYFDNLGSGNSIDDQFKNMEGSGEISMSYGINLGYQLSEKIKIRSGLSKVNLSYNTQNIEYAAAVNSAAIDRMSGEINLFSSASGNLNQSLGFIEIPLEIEYVLANKKIGLNIIGGGSTLFLDKNMITLNAPNFTARLGKGNNLNNVSFSANIGLGLNYNISRQFRLNLEPILKYQLNTFKNTSGLNPYYFGLYSGFSFKF